MAGSAGHAPGMLLEPRAQVGADQVRRPLPFRPTALAPTRPMLEPDGTPEQPRPLTIDVVPATGAQYGRRNDPNEPGEGPYGATEATRRVRVGPDDSNAVPPRDGEACESSAGEHA